MEVIEAIFALFGAIAVFLLLAGLRRSDNTDEPGPPEAEVAATYWHAMRTAERLDQAAREVQLRIHEEALRLADDRNDSSTEDRS